MKKKRKTKKKINQLIVGTMLVGVVSPFVGTINAHAEMSTYDKNRMLGATSIDWQSTNLREWLNSDKSIVDYTGLKPSYKDESGFLSNKNFTDAEKNAIAVTRHGVGLQGSLGGNINATLFWSQRSVAHNDYVANDKVFILHYTDLVNYIEKNKQMNNLNKKHYSNYLQRQTNRKDKYDYIVNSGYYNGGYVNVSVLYTSVLNEVSVRNSQNIVPALSLKPDYVLSNGVKAKDLQVGSTVTFGKYNDEPIEWQVINKADNGYPLLWSTKILAMKEYDAPGDINPNTSKYINFNTYDVDIFSGNGQAKSWETNGKIDSTTSINLLNESVLITPTNENEITLKIKAVDSKYGIRKIILPDGRTVNGDYTEWTLTENGEYDIIVENSIGVMTVKHIVTKAINTPAVVNITTDKDESTKWSNKPVNVSISASNNGVYKLTAYGNRNMGYGNSSSGVYPSWMPLGGKQLRITGTLKNAMTDAQASQVDMNAMVRVRLSMKWYNSSQVGWTWPQIKAFTLKELKEKGEIKIDEIYTIPSNAYNYVSPYVTFMDSNSAYMKSPYNYWMSNFDFEILDKDDLKIVEISFPDGNKSYTDTATYVISKNGSYTFSAKDNRGKVTSKTIEIAIDTDKPTLDISGVKPGYTTEQVLRIDATDSLSGIKRIKLPNGEYRTNSQEGRPLSVDYNIVKNGAYTFEAEDYAGNVTKKTVHITNVDTKPPVLNSQITPSGWTNQNVTIQLTASDEEGEIDFIQLPNGNRVTGTTASYQVSKNDDYSFMVQDKMGYQTTKNVTVSTIDKEKPTATYEVNHVNGDNYSVKVTAEDNLSGIKRIKLPDGTYANSGSAVYPTKKGEPLSFEVEDKAGNVFSYEFKATPPELTVYQKDDHVKSEWGIEMLDEDILTSTGFEDGEDNGLNLLSFARFDNVYYEEGEPYWKVFNYAKLITSRKYERGEKTNEYFADNGQTSLGKLGALNVGDTYTTFYKFNDGTQRLEYRRVGKGELSISSDVSSTGDKSLKIGKTSPNYGNSTGNASIIRTPKSYVIFNNIKGIPSGTDLSLTLSIKNEGKATIEPILQGGLREITTTYYGPGGKPLTVNKFAPKGSRKVYVDNLEQFPDNFTSTLYLSMEKLDNTMTPTFTYYRITDIDKADGSITLEKNLVTDVPVGFNLQRYSWGVPGSFNIRTINESSDWKTYSINTKVIEDEYYDVETRGFDFRMYFTTFDDVYIDNLKFGYATKAQLFRGNTKIYEGLLSDYEDTEATDKEKPNPVSNLEVKVKQGAIVMDIEKPNDNGTSYDYSVKAVSNMGDTVSSEQKQVTVTTGVDGYSYIVDTNASTVPDNTIDSRSDSISIPVTSNAKHYVHIKAIDKAGNVSSVSHIPFQDSVAPSLGLTQNPTTWTNSSVIITATAHDTELGVKRIKLPNGIWQNSSTATYPAIKNGTYTFVAEDYVGNQTTKSIVISNIDNTPPTPPTITNNQEWTKDTPVSVSITAGTDSQSGVKRVEYRLEGATNKNWTTYTGEFQIHNEGVTKIIARTVDKLEQYSTESVSYVRIDKSVPYNTGITIKLKGQ